MQYVTDFKDGRKLPMSDEGVEIIKNDPNWKNKFKIHPKAKVQKIETDKVDS